MSNSNILSCYIANKEMNNLCVKLLPRKSYLYLLAVYYGIYACWDLYDVPCYVPFRKTSRSVQCGRFSLIL